VGRDVLHLVGYMGEYHPLIASGPRPGEGISLSAASFLGNAAFLMNIVVPTYGTDGPLWSLAYEFAYYFAVPFAWLAIRGGVSPVWRIVAGAVSVAAVLWYPHSLTGLGLIWLAGALAYLAVPRVKQLSAGTFRALFALAGLALMVTLPLTYTYGNPGNALFGCACALVVPFLACLRNRGGLYGKTSFWLSEMSFTLYVVHFPLALFLWFWLFAPAQYPLGSQGIAIWSGLIAATLAYSFVMWWLFERNTVRVRKWAQRVMIRRG
jgi:peptidoglycan/LPS O-acetylase OafA/YrhL